MASGNGNFEGRLGDEKGEPSQSTTVSEKSSLHHEKGQQQQNTSDEVKIDLDFGEVQIRSRTSWWKIWIPNGMPPPPRSSLSNAPDIPLYTASIPSILTFAWVTPLMTLGYQRTLQATDLWKLGESHSSETLSKKLDESWARRKAEADAWNDNLDRGIIGPGPVRRSVWVSRSIFAGTNCTNKYREFEKKWRDVDGRKTASLALALNDTVGLFFWTGGMFKVFGDTSQLMGPIVIKAIINFAKKREAAREHGLPEPNVGIGIAMAIGLFLLTISASIGQHQFFWRSMVTGVLARAALIKSIYKRGVTLTGKARTQITNSDLVNHISTDVSRIDACAQWFHATWTAPIQITVCLTILLFQLGPSALAGFGLFLAIAPLQERAMAQQFSIRKRSMKYTDQRAKTLLEVLGSMRVVKYFSYEMPFLNRIYTIRRNELRGVKNILVSQSANVAFAFSIPVLAATLAFVTYTHVKPGFDVAIIFASLSLFQLLRQPMMFLPRALSATSDARSAISRLRRVFNAETRDFDSLFVDHGLKWAVRVEKATFEWEESLSNQDAAVPHQSLTPFRVEDIDMHVPRGSLVAVVGRVGSGKSSLLLGLIGEMRKVSGTVAFGGRVAYCPQTAWIQNASVRDNIIFGQPFNEERYWKVIEQASLLHDLQLLADGDLTEIGEKGVNLSGGQKQRINVARALYYDADVVIMDDPLSAVDAHVGKALFHDAILGALRNEGKTVIFVTHALHFLSQCDYIYTLRDGRVAEKGTYEELIQANGEFARLDKEFGGNETEQTSDQETQKVEANKEDIMQQLTSSNRRGAGTGKLEGKLIVKEQRSTGSISKAVYKAWFVAGRGWFTAPILVLSVLMMQGSQLTSSYTLVWWQANSFHRAFSFYQTLYAILGISQAISTFLSGCCTDIFSYFVSQNLHHEGITNIFYAPMAFFDTTPMGRIIGVFGKDIDNIDNQLPVSLRMLTLTVSNVLGSVVIITVVEHYFIIAAIVISLGYQYFAAFYRASAREVKRLDSMLRSLLYSHFSESLTGLSTLRTYGEIPRFLKENAYYIDLENRALILTVSNQRWLSIRLDFCGALLVFFVAIFAVTGASGSSAAQVGLILTYTTSLTQACGMLTRQTAEVENYLNSVERIVHYSQTDVMRQEAPHEIPENKPPAEWPQKGAIEFKDLSMKYRPGLPNVLHGISMSIRGGEKIGIVGRTGAGKSSITLALLRIVEYVGKITIDGVDISKIGLKDLRTKIAIIPQEPTIFSGTVRTALDPFSLYDDAHLWDALRRSFLVEDTKTRSSGEESEESATATGRISLDTVLESEGSNLSVGQRSLLSLARALVRETKVVILDEATASVDLETDKKIQHTIQTEFKDRTLICIAHRLRTILNYDRILVLDSGNIVEFDTPLSLFQNADGIFRALCDNSSITEKDFLA
ncbi:Multidrug resistance protein fer6 [Psilocybe cubensis]|uniref:Multidrug resistance protein fer6 n=2 Tax=Psilocybe cubensis TaxID=181762 RepID=A0ACB8H1A6_PSICU|nr:Multidrug resistance protein fer6 [Psilocybe cubensis]KAH9481477.1 Multidrug resistance protein fer6 [Psilocybe cubensis]